ncbi:hypothetical protein QYE76_061473 [Lolium multiflorum]|uniref:DUF7597 domain-containing protein n=1 Tax=Lolium multiflorum TaxID=4521 RepID=A0AAD8W583_LOLMU|nr:hypothetical protein QYE76_061473 [Lolium multiflorum]
MANYPSDPIPHLPPGIEYHPPGPLRTKRSYVVVGGELPLICDDWAIATLAPEAAAHEFNASIALIEHFLEGRGWGVKSSSRCGQGAALIQFHSAAERDAAIDYSPHFLGDTVLRFLPQNRGMNHCNAVFTHECWLMILNFPLECWDIETIMRVVAPFGRFVVWNKDSSNKARILVKIRPYNIDTLPLSLVIMQNNNDLGNGDSWSCPVTILTRKLLGAQGADEDPIPPGDLSPHPMPMGFDDVWAGGHGHGGLGAQGANEAGNQQQQHDMPAPGADENQPIVLEDMHDINPATPPLQDNRAHIIPANSPDLVTTLQNLLAAVTDNAGDLISRLGGTTITGASCKMVEIAEDEGLVKKYILQFDAVENITHVAAPSEIIPLPDAESAKVVQKNKRKKKEPVEVGPVRRSTRIAKNLGGYKDIESANAAGFIPVSEGTGAESEQSEDFLITNLAPRFEAVAHDADAPPPPHLPIETVRAIGTGLCKMPREAVSDEALLLDNE